MISKELLEGKKLKISSYNMLFRDNGTSFLYNCMKGTFLEICSDDIKRFSWLGSDGDRCSVADDKRFAFSWKGESKELKEALIEGGYVVPNSFNELEYLKFRNKVSRFSNKYYSLTILLTNACNMACKYCYENAPSKNGNMSDKVVKKLLGHIESTLKNKIEMLDITWYGGEPMLRYKSICSLSKKIIEYCKQYGAKYEASIVTNGALLTKARAEKLKENKVA